MAGDWDEAGIAAIIERHVKEPWEYAGIPTNLERVLVSVRYDGEYGIRDRVGIGTVEKFDDGDIDVVIDDGIEGFALEKKCKVYAWRPLPPPAKFRVENLA